MPVRDKAEVGILPMFTGRLRFSMGHPLGADGLDDAQWFDAQDFVTELFVQTMESIDFNRVLLEAGAMCEKKQDADPDHQPKVRGVYKDDSLFRAPGSDLNMEMVFCADCFRLCTLRLRKHEVMVQEDVAETLPEEHPPEGWKLPRHLAVEFAQWLKKRKETW